MRTSLNAVLAVCLVCAGAGLLPTTADAQVDAAVLPPPPAAMEAAAWLEGSWEGAGWIEQGGERMVFQGGERVEWRLGGRVLLVEGDFSAELEGAGRVPVHQALAILSWDPRSESYTFRTYTARGGNGEAWEAEVSDGRMEWGYELPVGGKIRYTIMRTEVGGWLERGYRQVDGSDWEQYFEMNLRRADAG